MKISSLIRKLRETQKYFGKDLDIAIEVSIPQTGDTIEVKPCDICKLTGLHGEERYIIHGKITRTFYSY